VDGILSSGPVAGPGWAVTGRARLAVPAHTHAASHRFIIVFPWAMSSVSGGEFTRRAYNQTVDGKVMRVGIIGGGTIARLFLEHIERGELGETRVVAIVGRSERSRGRPLAAEFKVPFVTGLDALVGERPDVVVEAASHEAVHDYAEGLL